MEITNRKSDLQLQKYPNKNWKYLPINTVIDGVCSCPFKEKCKSPGQHPGVNLKDNPKWPTSNINRIKTYQFYNPDSNWAVATGSGSDIVVLELEGQEGELSLSFLEKENGLLPKTIKLKGGNGNSYFFFKAPPEKIRNLFKIRPNLHIRGDGGYVILPPCTHVSGNQYEWIEGHSPFDIEPSDMPEWLLKLILKKLKQFKPIEQKRDYHRDRNETQISKPISSKYKQGRSREIDIHFAGNISPDECMKFFNSKFSFVIQNGKAYAIDDELNHYSLTSGKQIFLSMMVEYEALNKKGETDVKLMNSFEFWWKNVRQKYEGIIFDPTQDEPVNNKINIWKRFAVEPNPDGNCSLFIEYLKENVADGDQVIFDFIMDWLAQMIQEPDKKIGVVLALCGEQGTGKSIVGEVVGALYPKKHFLTINRIESLTRRFNAHLAGAILVMTDEALWGGDKKVSSILKNLITSPTIPIEEKGKQCYEIENYMRLLMTSNESWMAPVEKSDRRYFITKVNNNRKNDRSFFKAMIEQLKSENGYGKLLYILQTRDFSQRDWGKIPQTEARLENMLSGLSPFERWVYESLCSGSMAKGDAFLMFNGIDENGGMVQTKLLFERYKKFLSDSGYRNSMSDAIFGKNLKDFLGVRRDRKREKNGRVYVYLIESIALYRERFMERTGIHFEDIEDSER